MAGITSKWCSTYLPASRRRGSKQGASQEQAAFSADAPTYLSQAISGVTQTADPKPKRQPSRKKGKQSTRKVSLPVISHSPSFFTTAHKI